MRVFEEEKNEDSFTCESFENSNALEALEVVDENIGNPEVGQELKADRVPGILIISLKLSRICL